METIAVANQKGGVGKTTSVMNLAAELSARGYRCLTVDLDPQATLSMAAGYEQLDQNESIAALLLPEMVKGECSPQATPWGGEILAAPGRLMLSDAEILLMQPRRQQPYQRLAHALADFQAAYDLCLIDTPPQLGCLSLNALTAAEWALLPVSPDWFSVGGLALMLETIEHTRQVENPRLQLLGVFPTLVKRTTHASEWRLGLERQLGEQWIDIAVPQAVAVQDAPQARLPLREYDPDGRATHAYRQLADRVLARTGIQKAKGVEVG